MKKVSETEYNGWYESASRLIIYAIEDDDEWRELEETSEEEILDLLGYRDEFNVMPGAKYYTYEGKLMSNHYVVTETVAYNV